MTLSVARFGARWIPVVGWLLFLYDGYQVIMFIADSGLFSGTGSSNGNMIPMEIPTLGGSGVGVPSNPPLDKKGQDFEK